MPSKRKDNRKLEVQGLEIRIEPIHKNDYISLTDIVKKSSDDTKETIRNWIKNSNTISFLWAWEEIHNPDFKGVHLHAFKGKVADNRYNLSPTKWITETGAIGILSKRGRHGGGTFAHKDIALEFCSWYDPYFKVFLMKELQRLKKEEASRKQLEWDIRKITDNIDEIRNILDTIEGQSPLRNRLDSPKK